MGHALVPSFMGTTEVCSAAAGGCTNASMRAADGRVCRDPLATKGRNTRIQLDERLACIERMAGRCKRIVDVGTNHGFLPVHMLQSGLCENALLCDISADALSRARRTLTEEGIVKNAELCVTDGLKGIDLQAGDVVTICGMGARTIAHILDSATECPVVMQANVELKYLRRHLERIGMHIANEDIAFAAGRYYVILRAEPDAEEPMTEYEAHIGRALLRRKPALLKDYLLWRKSVTGRALQGMESGRDAEKLQQARQDYEDVLRALKEAEEA